MQGCGALQWTPECMGTRQGITKDVTPTHRSLKQIQELCLSYANVGVTVFLPVEIY